LVSYARSSDRPFAPVTHQVALLDAQRVPLGERAMAHEAAALHALTEWLILLAGGDPVRVAVALKVPRGAVVDTFPERGFHVFGLNLKQLDHFRYTVAGAKDDRRDEKLHFFVIRSVLCRILSRANPHVGVTSCPSRAVAPVLRTPVTEDPSGH
jgi:transposase